MADQKITALTANTAPVLADLLVMVDDPAGTPATQKVTFQSLWNHIEVRVASGDPVIPFDIGGTDKFTIGVDDSDGDKFKVSRGGALGANDVIDIDSSGNIVINEGGASTDLRVEGNTEANLFVVDGSLDAVAFGVATPDVNVRVQIEPVANDWALHLNSPNTASQSFGLKITAGTDSADQAVLVSAADGLSNVFTIKGDGTVGIGIAAGLLGQLHIDQTSTTGAKPVTVLDQADVSEEFVRFIGTAAVGVLTQSIVDEGDQASQTLEGWIKVYVQDDGDQITDQAYFIPIYTLSA